MSKATEIAELRGQVATFKGEADSQRAIARAKDDTIDALRADLRNRQSTAMAVNGEDQTNRYGLPRRLKVAVATHVAALEAYVDRAPVKTKRDVLATLGLATDIAELHDIVGQLDDEEQAEVDRYTELFSS